MHVLVLACAALYSANNKSRKAVNPTQDATVRGLQHAATLANQAATAYGKVQHARSPTLAVFQNTR